MPKLILIRHSLPEIVPDLPASQWHLSLEGQRRCAALAARLACHQPGLVMTSLEPKAMETGQAVASILDLPLVTATDLHEHQRDSVSFCADEIQFREHVKRLLEHPDDRVFGEETGNQAHQRFSRAITLATQRHPSQNLAVVTHGTVLSMFVSRAAGIKAVALWKRLGMPSFVALRLPDYDLLEIVANLSSPR